jgi:hypothetical protein
MHRHLASRITAAVAGVLALASVPYVASPAAAVDAVITTDGCLTSVPDPGTTAPVDICFTLFRPAGATKDRPVPMVLHSHGWGGSRTTDPAAFAYLTDAGFGVLSFDQRGFGESGGRAHIENPDVEGKDVQRIVDVVAAQPWVEKQSPATRCSARSAGPTAVATSSSAPSASCATRARRASTPSSRRSPGRA